MSTARFATTFTIGKKYATSDGTIYLCCEEIPAQPSWKYDDSDGVPKLVETIDPAYFRMSSQTSGLEKTSSQCYFMELPNPIEEGLAIIKMHALAGRKQKISSQCDRLRASKKDLIAKAVRLQSELQAVFAEIPKKTKELEDLQEEWEQANEAYNHMMAS